jgi:hypothetical protein
MRADTLSNKVLKQTTETIIWCSLEESAPILHEVAKLGSNLFITRGVRCKGTDAGKKFVYNVEKYAVNPSGVSLFLFMLCRSKNKKNKFLKRNVAASQGDRLLAHVLKLQVPE